jgi:hypothetical protein
MSSDAAWYRDRNARALLVFAYLPWFALLSLAWEAAHVPLYTLWTEAESGYIAFSVLHCTLGDVLIGGASLLLALIIGRERVLARWQWGRLAALTAFFGAGYTVFSEWMNIKILRSWTYADSMPTINLSGFELGLTPLAQWLIVPPLALYLARLRAEIGLKELR